MFQIKICGVTDEAAAAACVAAGADALGLNFYPPSPRFVSREIASRICAALPESVRRVGVFVNASPEAIIQTAAQLALDWVQLHGDEPPETIAQLHPWPVIRAFRLGKDGPGPLFQYLRDCAQAGRRPDAVLVDAWRAGEYGGTGQQVDWQIVARLVQHLDPLPVVLAGGLTPHNVMDAIRTARPRAVDTASGVESRPGEKDAERVRDFVFRVREAFDSLEKSAPDTS